MKALIKGLPPESALFRSMPDMGGWTVTDHLLASVIDALGTVGHNALVGPHADPKKLRKINPPERFPRPGYHKPRRRASADDLRAMFGGGEIAYRPKGVTDGSSSG